MRTNYLLPVAINGFLVVLFGSFGAHALELRGVDAYGLDVWDTAVQYQMFHTLGFLALYVLQRDQPALSLRVDGLLFGGGIVLFCGSLYLLVLTGHRVLGMITPIGGLLFLAAWAKLALTCYRLKQHG